MSEISLRIDGMHCGSCIRRVTQAIAQVPGAEPQEVRIGAAHVHTEDATAPEAIVAALATAGFRATLEP
jgi:copper chaperone CopZ